MTEPSKPTSMPGREDEAGEPYLSTPEAALVDRLLSAGDSAGRPVDLGPQPDDESLRSIHAALTALSHLPEPVPPPGLAWRTLAIIRRRILGRQDARENRVSSRISWPHWRVLWTPRWANIAALLLVTGVVMALITVGLIHSRQSAEQIACTDNLRQLAGAFGAYAAGNAGRLPELAPPQDGDWLPRGLTGSLPRSADAHSNLANLALLVDGPARYTTWRHFICPACPTVAASQRPLSWRQFGYSYLDQLARHHHHWNGRGQVVVLADRNPLFYAQGNLSAQMNSLNHGERGQNLLYDDGHVDWATSPDVGPAHDDIWTVGHPPLLHFTGLEEPSSRRDILVVP